jgi:CheY-like chemotaxis protein
MRVRGEILSAVALPGMDGARPAPSLLVVEDDQAVGAYLADNLAADGFGVASARGAAEALRAIEVRGPDLVLLDLMLGDGNGLSVLDRVRGADGLASRVDPALPMIILSGRATEADRVRGFARGADDYVLKATASLSPSGIPTRRRTGQNCFVQPSMTWGCGRGRSQYSQGAGVEP